MMHACVAPQIVRVVLCALRSVCVWCFVLRAAWLLHVRAVLVFAEGVPICMNR